MWKKPGAFASIFWLESTSSKNIQGNEHYCKHEHIDCLRVDSLVEIMTRMMNALGLEQT